MVAEVRCPNPSCRRPSSLGRDALGRTFRCARCGTKLPRSTSKAATTPPWATPDDSGEWRSRGVLPWEVEAERSGRSLGSASPSRIGRFQIRGILGSGSCATVYRAFDPDLEREIALKVPNPGLAASEKALARFVGEARALARLRHPGIVAVFEAGVSGDSPYLATAYIAGRTLSAEIAEGPVDYPRAAEIAAELAEALDEAHRSAVVHRDVKPANVLVSTDGRVHLTDFGLAWRSDAASSKRTWSLIGTPAYVAPEQAAEGDVDALPASDQYSLGVVLYELLCGRPPFLGPPALVLYAASQDDPVPPRLFRPGVPRGLERICLKAMARRPGDRYPDCQSLAADLRRYLSGRRLGTWRMTPGAIEGAAAWMKRRPSAAVATALGLFGLAASAVLATALLASPPADSTAPRSVLPSFRGVGPLLAASPEHDRR